MNVQDWSEDLDSKNKLGVGPLFPIAPFNYFVTLLLAAMVTITNAAGVGGGGAILPIVMLYGFTVSAGVGLSNVSVCVAALTKFIMEFNKSHPHRKARIIDYGIVVLMMPAIMLGSFIGIQLNIVVPQAFIWVFLIIIL